jgi:hypothetical protein
MKVIAEKDGDECNGCRGSAYLQRVIEGGQQLGAVVPVRQVNAAVEGERPPANNADRRIATTPQQHNVPGVVSERLRIQRASASAGGVGKGGRVERRR